MKSYYIWDKKDVECDKNRSANRKAIIKKIFKKNCKIDEKFYINKKAHLTLKDYSFEIQKLVKISFF